MLLPEECVGMVTSGKQWFRVNFHYFPQNGRDIGMRGDNLKGKVHAGPTAPSELTRKSQPRRCVTGPSFINRSCFSASSLGGLGAGFQLWEVERRHANR